MMLWRASGLLLLGAGVLYAQSADPPQNNAGYVPVLSGGMGYVHNVNGGVTSLEPQIDPILLLPLGSHFLIESRVDFTGYYQRQNLTYGPYTGTVYQTLEFAQLDWLASTPVMATVGMYLLPFGMYNERLDPIWIRNLQDPPITAAIGNGSSGAGDGIMLRGVPYQNSSFSIQYSSYFSALSTISKIQASRTAGGDTSIFFGNHRLEIGTSYQRYLQGRQTNNVASYLSWQPPRTPLDVKFEYDRSYNGQGYWLENALWLRQSPFLQNIFQRFQFVTRMQQFDPFHGGGNGLPSVGTNRFDAGLNYYFKDDLRLISSYGRQFSSKGNENVWNAGITYRFLLPLWPGRNK